MADVEFITRELRFDSPSLTVHAGFADPEPTSFRPVSASCSMLFSLAGFPHPVNCYPKGYLVLNLPYLW